MISKTDISKTDISKTDIDISVVDINAFVPIFEILNEKKYYIVMLNIYTLALSTLYLESILITCTCED